MEKLEPSCIAGENVSWDGLFGKAFDSLSKS